MGLSIILILLESFTLLVRILYPYLSSLGIETVDEIFRQLVRPLAPLLVVLLMYGSWFKLGVRLRKDSRKLASIIHYFSKPFNQIIVSVRSFSIEEGITRISLFSRTYRSLIVAIIIAILLAYYPYRPDLNPTGKLVGVDTPS